MTDSFDADFGVAEWYGTNAFIRDGDNVYRTYFINDREHDSTGRAAHPDITESADHAHHD